MTRRECIALTALVPLTKADTKPTVIGDGWGLDHFMVALADYGSTKSVYADKLGFTIFPGAKRPAGYENAVIILGPAYIELLSFYDLQHGIDSGDKFAMTLLEKVRRGGGPFAYNIDVSPIDAAVTMLRERGMEVGLPPSQIILRDGKEVRGGWQFLSIKTPGMPPPVGVPGGDKVGFLEYRDNQRKVAAKYSQDMRDRAERELPDPRRLAGELHANTARKMRSVWVAVASVDDAVKHSELFGFAPVADRKSDFLGAQGREVQCGQGTIVFWKSDKAGSRLSSVVDKLGPGPFGVSIDVADLKRCHEIVERGTDGKLPLDDSSGRKSFIVAAELTGGTWVEFGQA